MSAHNDLQQAIKQLRDLQGSHGPFRHKLAELDKQAKQLKDLLKPKFEIDALLAQSNATRDLERELFMRKDAASSIRQFVDEHEATLNAIRLPTMTFDAIAFDKASNSFRQLLKGTDDQGVGGILALLVDQLAKGPAPALEDVLILKKSLGKLPVISAKAAQTVEVTQTATATVGSKPAQQVSNDQLAGLVMFVLAQLTKKKTFTRYEFQTVVLYPLLLLMVSALWIKLVEGWMAKPQAVPVVVIQLDERRATRPLVIRMNPGMKSPKIGELGAGVVAEVLQSQKDWTMVETRDAKGNRVMGWVLSRYLERAPRTR